MSLLHASSLIAERSIVVFKRVCQWDLSWTSWTHFVPSHSCS